MLDRQRIADLWWELMQIPRECFYTDKPQHIPMNLTEDSKVMSPGYVGRTYQPGGWLLIGHFPAGGTEGYTVRRDPSDQRLYDAFRALRDTGDDPDLRRGNFETMSDIWIENQSRHRIYSNLIRHALDAGGLEDHDVAFLNLFPYRTRENKRPTSSMLRSAWNIAVSRQIEALQPGRIIALGIAVSDALDTLYEGRLPVTVLRRSNGDHYLTAEAKSAISELEVDTPRIDATNPPETPPTPQQPKSRPIPVAHASPCDLGWNKDDYIALLQELGFETPRRGLTLKHRKPVPSVYFNIKRDGSVYFVTHIKDRSLFSSEHWMDLPAQQAKDRENHLVTKRPIPGCERTAFQHLLAAA